MVGALGVHRHIHQIYQQKLKEKEIKKAPQKQIKNSLEELASLEILLNQNAYHPGETIQGVVNYFVKKDITDKKPSKLVLHIKGFMVFYEKNEINNIKVTKTQSIQEPVGSDVHQHIFYNHRFVLSETNEDEPIEMGIYSFPFDFQLHKKLPRTLKINDEHINFLCFYKIGVFWQRSSHEKLKSIVDLSIIQEPPLLIMNFLASKSSSEFQKEVCCFTKPKKAITLEVFASENIIKENEMFPAFCKLKMANISLNSLFFTKLEITIVRLVRLHFKGVEKKFFQTILAKEIIEITKNNTEQTDPDTLKVAFSFKGMKLPSVSINNKYIRVAYLLKAKPAGLHWFHKEKYFSVNNQSYLYFLPHEEEATIKKMADMKKILDSENKILEQSSLLASTQSPLKSSKKQELFADLEKELRELLEKETPEDEEI